MPAPNRITRVNENLKREIADLLEREKFMDGSCLLSVTGVNTSGDLRKATVGISILGVDNDDTRREALKFLLRHRCALQKKISRDITLKYTPVLEFRIDHGIEQGDRVLEILNDLEKEDSGID
jgi:ribosome-binding factor A